MFHLGKVFKINELLIQPARNYCGFTAGLPTVILVYKVVGILNIY